mmetsp:Transcript_52118/g.122394  ORF Transcript_52118/g.122394 Transcript_52118/m.122394 type:complete len:240 (+) Transcript_52118:1687-2406(+)
MNVVIELPLAKTARGRRVHVRNHETKVVRAEAEASNLDELEAHFDAAFHVFWTFGPCPGLVLPSRQGEEVCVLVGSLPALVEKDDRIRVVLVRDGQPLPPIVLGDAEAADLKKVISEGEVCHMRLALICVTFGLQNRESRRGGLLHHPRLRQAVRASRAAATKLFCAGRLVETIRFPRLLAKELVRAQELHQLQLQREAKAGNDGCCNRRSFVCNFLHRCIGTRRKTPPFGVALLPVAV